MELRTPAALLRECARRLDIQTDASLWEMEALYALYVWYFVPKRESERLPAVLVRLRTGFLSGAYHANCMPAWFVSASAYLLRDTAERAASRVTVSHVTLEPLAAWYLGFAIAWCANHWPAVSWVDESLVKGAVQYAQRKRSLDLDPFFL